MSRHVPRHTLKAPPPPPPLHVMVARPAQVTQVTQVPHTQHNTTQRRPRVTRHTLCGGTVAQHGPSPPPPPPWPGKLRGRWHPKGILSTLAGFKGRIHK